MGSGKDSKNRVSQKIKKLINKLENYYISLKRIISKVNNYNYYVGFSFRLGKILKKEYHNGT